jgi:hypothetical protein
MAHLFSFYSWELNCGQNRMGQNWSAINVIGNVLGNNLRTWGTWEESHEKIMGTRQKTKNPSPIPPREWHIYGTKCTTMKKACKWNGQEIICLWVKHISHLVPTLRGLEVEKFYSRGDDAWNWGKNLLPF